MIFRFDEQVRSHFDNQDTWLHISEAILEQMLASVVNTVSLGQPAVSFCPSTKA